MATKIKKAEFAGVGALVQFIGVILCFVAFPLGVLPGLLLLIIGGRMAIVIKCSECRGKIDKEANICPHCRAAFDK